MSNVWWILKRELGSYLRSPLGYVIITVVLVADGLLFNAYAMGSQAKLSALVLQDFFFITSGLTVAASIFLAMRLIAEEKQTGTLVLLTTSPVKDWELVLGKFLGALTVLIIMNALTLYMPLLVMVNGKVSFGHLFAGYLGLILIDSAALALCLLCSAIAPTQLIAAITGSAVVVIFIVLWVLSKIASPPLEDVIAYMSIHDKHFKPFMRGLVSLGDAVFYISLTYVALLSATRVLEARRWRA